MFERLQKKWKVGGLRLFLIIFTFAIGGSVTGFIGKKVMNWLAIGHDWLWAVVYILLITIIWPLAVLVVSIPFGQFRFFIKYIKKIGARMGIVRSPEFRAGSRESELTTHDSRLITHIAIFASGAGSNAQKIIDHFASPPTPLLMERGVTKSPRIVVSLIVCNNPAAGVLNIAAKENIPALIIKKEKFFGS